jgi:general L-amino acid transport system permease protein
VPLTVLAIIIVTAMIFSGIEGQTLSGRRVVSAVVGVISALGLAYLLYTGATELWFIAESVSAGEGVLSGLAGLIFKGLSIFTFVMFIPMGLFVGYAIFQSAEDGGLVTIVTALLCLYAMVALVLGPVSGWLNSIVPIELLAVPSRDMGGYMLCLILGTVCVSLSIPLGILLALGRQSNMPLIKGFCVVFIEFIRGVPLITLLFVANVMLAYFFPPESSIDLILRVIIMITMFSSAYIAEVVRGGLAALPKGQFEAADSLGLNYTQAVRLIILPQALKISIPGIVNVAVGLFKDTVLVSVISMFDIVGMIRGPIQQSTDWLSVYWELYLFAALVFFVVCYSISQYSQWLERQLQTGHR